MQRYNFFRRLLHRNSLFFDFARSYVQSKPNSEVYIRTRLSQLRTCERTGIIVRFSDINKRKIIELNSCFLASGFAQTYMRCIHATMYECIKAAVREGFLHDNPYVGLALEKGRPEEPERFVSRKSLQKIEAHIYKYPATQFSADMFVFQCHTGLAYTDLMSVTYDNIKTHSDKKWLISQRNKTKVDYYIPLDEKALELIEKYRKGGKNRSKLSENNLFPFIPLVTYNSNLKTVGRHAGIPERLMSHKGRHTFASLKLEDGVSIESIKKMLGHSGKSDVTWLYAKVTMQKIRKEVDGGK